MNIKIRKGGRYLDCKFWQFPGGEVGVKLNADDYAYREEKAPHQTIIARIQNSNDVMALAMVKDALERFDETPIQLFMPYVAYGRQDRQCVKGESFSLKVFCDLINSLNFEKVIICDPHSDVTPALINRVKVISQFDIINRFLLFINRVRTAVFIAPDAGANKKTATIAKFFDAEFFVRADKLRNLSSGEILETIVYREDFNGRDVAICDDLADFSKTFIELAKVLKTRNVGKIILYVTHGLFSGGFDHIFAGDIDEIYTTNAYRNIGDKRVNVLDLEEKFLND